MAILDMVQSQLDSQKIQQISESIGADPGATQKAIGVALPLLLGGLARNANQSPQGAASLANALDRDHGGDLLSSLGGGGLGSLVGAVLGGGGSSKQTQGGKILEHIFGGKRSGVEQGIERASGLDSRKVSQLLALLAPIVMSALAKRKQQANLDAGDVAKDLQRERSEIESSAGAGGLFGMLDRDDDGSIVDDVASLGTSLAKGWLKGR